MNKVEDERDINPVGTNLAETGCHLSRRIRHDAGASNRKTKEWVEYKEILPRMVAR